MTKKWTQSEVLSGRSVSPKILNDELRAQQSSITTLDRDQLPFQAVDEDRLADYALHQVWAEDNYPSGGENAAERDTTNIGTYKWLCSTQFTLAGGWRSISGGAALNLQGFKGGNLYGEWSCNAYAQNVFAKGAKDGTPGSPMYVRMRILVNGIVMTERRGAACHQTIRLVGAMDFPPGDLSVELQYKLTAPSEDYAVLTAAGNRVTYAHLWNNRYLFIGRYR